ncbi:MAG: hypothetical protein EZS28_037658 [Streblomastix strix]|uniref:Uncharacterized protein n=1 Tax=Streblomastix strix TaxID=222440 RepID=A0A5J4U7H6_9EUKA|nr:MAG: hypothetical protein EZS28_037658 [Streblomastix strix]
MNNALDYFVKEVKLHEYISPFLHLNCMALKCTRNIAIPIDQFSIQFHSQVFGMFERLIVYNEVRIHLMEKHGIFANVAPMLASFVSSSSFHGQQENNKEVQLAQTSITFDVISELIPFLHTFLDNNRDGSEIASFTPGFLTSIFKIAKYKRNEYVRNDQHYNFDNQKLYNFRRQSIQCLGCIIQYGGIDCQQKLITDGFIREISDVFGSSSGEIFNRVIEEAILILTNFYYGFCNGRQRFQQQPEMKKQSDELIEESGIIEECECHLYRRKRIQWGHVRFRAKKLKFQIDNNYMDPKNVKFQHFILHGIMDEEESEDEDDQFHIGQGYDSDYGINQLSDEQYWNLMHGGGQMFNQQDDYEDDEDYY